MDKPITFQLYLRHVASFDDLMDLSHDDDEASMIREAVTLYTYYTDQTGEDKQQALVVYNNQTPAEYIDDRITSAHRSLGWHTVNTPLSVFEDVPEDLHEDLVMRALVLYEHLVYAQSQGLWLGLYNEKTGQITPIESGARDGANLSKFKPYGRDFT